VLEPEEDPLALLRETGDGVRAEEWALVLASQGIAYVLGRSDDAGWILSVATTDLERATQLLSTHEDDQPLPPEPPIPSYGESGAWVLTLSVLSSLATVFVLAGQRGTGRWFRGGSANAERIVAGEWWRTVTALYLHGDLGHILSNAAMSLVLVSAVGWWLGPGVGALLLVLSGALANLAVALVVRHGFDSVGFSTALFAAVGILGALGVVARRARRRAFIVAGACLAFLGLVGTGEHSDVLAHLLGMLTGTALGATTGLLWRRPAGLVGQLGAGVIAIAISVGAWWVAYSRS